MSMEPIAANRALGVVWRFSKRFDRPGVGVARRLVQNDDISVSFVGFCGDCCSFAIIENRANKHDKHRGSVAELAYAADLKSAAARLVGSSPTAPTKEFARRLQPEGSGSRKRGRSPATPTKEERGFQMLCFA